VVATLVGAAAVARIDPACPLDASLPASEVFIAYVGEVRETTQDGRTVRLGPIRPLALIRQGKLFATDGRIMGEGMRLWNVRSPEAPPLILRNVSSFLDRMGEDHCVYAAEVKIKEIPLWTLLASKSLKQIFRQPRSEDVSFFRMRNDSCVDQGDYELSKKPPCTRPQLLAVSDIDRDGVSEYWATQPYTWDTGITVWKPVGRDLIRLLEVCSGCSD